MIVKLNILLRLWFVQGPLDSFLNLPLPPPKIYKKLNSSIERSERAVNKTTAAR